MKIRATDLCIEGQRESWLILLCMQDVLGLLFQKHLFTEFPGWNGTFAVRTERVYLVLPSRSFCVHRKQLHMDCGECGDAVKKVDDHHRSRLHGSGPAAELDFALQSTIPRPSDGGGREDV